MFSKPADWVVVAGAGAFHPVHAFFSGTAGIVATEVELGSDIVEAVLVAGVLENARMLVVLNK